MLIPYVTLWWWVPKKYLFLAYKWPRVAIPYRWRSTPNARPTILSEYSDFGCLAHLSGPSPKFAYARVAPNKSFISSKFAWQSDLRWYTHIPFHARHYGHSFFIFFTSLLFTFSTFLQLSYNRQHKTTFGASNPSSNPYRR
jgi:hypothetical protein